MKAIAHFRAILGLTLLLAANMVATAQQPELVIQTGHTNRIYSVSFSPDRKVLASGSWDNTVKLWSVETGKQLKSFAGHTSFVKSVMFSPDGKMLASGSWDRTVKLWSVKTGKLLNSFASHTSSSESVAFSPDGKTLASGGSDSTVKLWSIETGQQIKSLTGHTNDVQSVVFSPDGKMLVSGSSDCTVRLWNVETGQQIKSSYAHAYPVYSVVFSPDGKMLASGSMDSTIKLWSVETQQLIKSFASHTSSVSSIAFSPDGQTLASGSGDLWNIETGQLIKSFAGQNTFFSSVAFSPDGKTLALGSSDKTIKLWNVKTGQQIKSFAGYAVEVESVAFSPNGKTLASGSSDNIVKLWNVETGQQTKSLTGHTNHVHSVVFSPDGKTLASGSSDNSVKLWNVETGQLTKSFEGHTLIVKSVAFSPDGKTLCSGGYDGTVKLWNVETGQQIKSFAAHSLFVSSVVFSPDGKTLASGSGDRIVKLWNVETGQQIKSFAGHTLWINSIAFSPDGKALASGGSDNSVKLWNVETGQLTKSFTYTDSVYSVVFSPDGKTLASGGSDNTVKLWNVETGQLTKSFAGHTNLVESVVYLPGGKLLVSGSNDGTIKLWNLESDQSLATLTSLGEKDWTVITPNGGFDASPNAEKLLHYVVSSTEYGYEVINLEQLKWRYYEPGLLRKIINGEQLRDVTPFRNVELYPKVEEIRRAGQSDASTKRTIKLTNRGGGIGRVQVFVNGSEFIEDARNEKLKQNPNVKEAVITFDLKGANERIIAGRQPKVEIIAWNYDAKSKEGYISSRGTEIVYAPQVAAPVATPELYAIIGGVSDYVGDALDLHFAAKDAEDFYKAIEVGGKNLFGAEKVHLKLLATGDNPKASTPTKANFKKAFEEFAKQAKPTDVFLVYLAGHGVTFGRGTDTYLYLTKDARTTDTSVLSDKDLRDQVSISSDELTEWHKAVLAQKQVLILDTCAAGAAATKLVEKRDLSSDAIRAIDRMQYRRGFHVLMGSAADAVSYEASQYGQGLLTYTLLQGIKSGEALQDGQIDVAKLFNFAADNTPRLANNIGGIQRPEIRIPYGGASFAVGFIKNEQDKALIPLAQLKPLILRPILQNQRLGYDNLKLTVLLRDALREASFVTTRGGHDAQVIFVDADEMPDALIPAGNYTIEGDTIKITLNLIRNDNPAATVEVTGDKNNLPDLISKLLAKLMKAAINGITDNERYSKGFA